MTTPKIKKVLLIFPPCPIPKMFPKRVQIPLGIAYLAGALRKEDIEVALLDSLVEGWDNIVELDHENIQFGLPPSEIAARAESFKPDLVGISCMYSVQARLSCEIAGEIKKRLPDTKVCVGGAHASAMPEDLAKDDNIDFVIMGEGERSLVELIFALNNNLSLETIDGFTSGRGNIKNPKTQFIEDLGQIPLPAIELLPLEKYFKINRPHGTISKNRRIVPIVTSRGCPAKCVFCSIHPVWGRRYRARSPEDVVNEIEMLVKRHGVEEIHIEDDNFTFDKKRAEKICDLIIERDLKVAFAAPNGLAVWALDEGLLRKLKQIGFYKLTLAVESGSQDTLNKIIHKPLKIEQVIAVIDSARRVGFEIDIFFVVGFPGESMEEMQKTFDLGRKLDVSSVKYFIATPYPGTELMDIALRENLLVRDFDPLDVKVSVVRAMIRTEHFTPEELERKVLSETTGTQVALLLRHPFRYFSGIVKNYVIKDPGATFVFAWGIVKNLFRSK